MIEAPTSLRCAAVAAALALSACQQTMHERWPGRYDVADPEELREIERHEAYLAEFRAQQRKVAWRNVGPRSLRFEGHGTVLVEKWYLEGLPGEEYVRIRFTYVNDTDATFAKVRLWVTIRDGEGEPRLTEWKDLQVPFGYDHLPRSHYTDEIRVPTRGAHHEEDWSWSLGIFGVRPVEVVPPTPEDEGR